MIIAEVPGRLAPKYHAPHCVFYLSRVRLVNIMSKI